MGLKAVVLVDSAFSLEVRAKLGRHHMYKRKVTYLKGSVFSSHDLERAGVRQATAIFLCSSVFSQDDAGAPTVQACKLLPPPRIP